MNIKSILGFPNYYASDEGNIYRKTKKGKLNLLKPYLGGGNSPSQTKGKYKVVALHINGVAHRKYVHQIVLQTFKGDRPESNLQCAHWNGNRNDNSISNLRWATARQNAADKKRYNA